MARILLIVFLSAVLFSCSEYQKVIKSSDYKYKREKAMEYYNKKKYSKAIVLFEELLTVYRGTSQAEEIYYYYAQSHFGVGDYLLANYYFSNFAGSYPTSPYAEEAEYMAAFCHYKDSPRETLDQTSTHKAISELQYFVDRFPQSPRVQTCNELIETLRAKLESKAYRNAYQYYHMEYYNSAAVLFSNLLKDFPDTKHRPEVSFMIIKSSYMYGSLSVKSKKKERLLAAKENYLKFADKLAASKFGKDANEIYEKIGRELDLIGKEERGELYTKRVKKEKKEKKSNQK